VYPKFTEWLPKPGPRARTANKDLPTQIRCFPLRRYLTNFYNDMALGYTAPLAKYVFLYSASLADSKLPIFRPLFDLRAPLLRTSAKTLHQHASTTYLWGPSRTLPPHFSTSLLPQLRRLSCCL
jgi:hypothetical protein